MPALRGPLSVGQLGGALEEATGLSPGAEPRRAPSYSGCHTGRWVPGALRLVGRQVPNTQTLLVEAGSTQKWKLGLGWRGILKLALPLTCSVASGEGVPLA